MSQFSFPATAGIFLIVAFTLSSCGRDLIGIDGSGANETETRTPGNFEGVDLSIDAKVILHYDSNCHAEVTAQPNIQDVLTTEIHGNKICIGFRRHVIQHNPITIHLYAPYFTSVAISGSGDILTTDAIFNGNFSSSISGSGNIDLTNVQASAAEIKISGSGSVRLSGQAQSLHTHTSGSGDIHTFDLIVQTGDVRVSGSGNVEINAAQQLDVDISGSGDVYYKNNPALDLEVSGSGHVHHVN